MHAQIQSRLDALVGEKVVGYSVKGSNTVTIRTESTREVTLNVDFAPTALPVATVEELEVEHIDLDAFPLPVDPDPFDKAA
jgi:hypothetical protein